MGTYIIVLLTPIVYPPQRRRRDEMCTHPRLESGTLKAFEVEVCDSSCLGAGVESNKVIFYLTDPVLGVPNNKRGNSLSDRPH